jgi:non-specific serine/threonine protein kinase
VAAAIDSLVDASLVHVQEMQGLDHRIGMLQTLREFAAEKLTEQGAEPATRRRHLAAMVRLSELYDQGFRSPTPETWLSRLDTEYGNVTAALEWSLDHEPVQGLRLAGAIQSYWDTRALIRTGCQWLEILLDAEAAGRRQAGKDRDAERAAWRARGLMGAAALGWLAGDVKSAERHGAEGYALVRELGEPADVARAANQIGIIAMIREQFDRARDSFEEALSIHTAINDERGVFTVTNNLGVVAIGTGEFARAAELLERSLTLSARYGDIRSRARAMTNLGFALLNLGDIVRAKQLARESLVTRNDLGDPRGVCECLELLAGIAVAENDWPAASRMLGASTKRREEHGVSFATRQLEAFVTATSEEARTRLGEEGYLAALSDGSTMAVSRLLGLVPEAAQVQHEPSLTPAAAST